MKICAISDTHNQHHSLDMSKYPADILIHAGDWTGGKDTGLAETQNFLAWFSQQPYNHLICIAGNHEKRVEAEEAQFRELLLMYPNIIYLQDSGVTIDNINIYGSPYTNEFCNWAFMEEELELDHIWQQIPDDTNILITHGPAYGTLDLVKHAYGRDPHVGSTSLQNRKLELQGTLKLHIHGHIHCAAGIVESGTTTINASVLDDSYTLVNEPTLFTLKGHK